MALSPPSNRGFNDLSEGGLHESSIKQAIRILFEAGQLNVDGGLGPRFSWHVSKGRLPGKGQSTVNTVSIFGTGSPSSGQIEITAIGRHLRREKGKNVYGFVHYQSAADRAAYGPGQLRL